MHKNGAIKFFLIEFRRSKKVENFYDIVAKKHMMLFDTSGSKFQGFPHLNISKTSQK